MEATDASRFSQEVAEKTRRRFASLFSLLAPVQFASFLFQRENGFPIILHAHHGPTMSGGFI
jgi:hypothetical protein